MQAVTGNKQYTNDGLMVKYCTCFIDEAHLSILLVIRSVLCMFYKDDGMICLEYIFLYYDINRDHIHNKFLYRGSTSRKIA